MDDADLDRLAELAACMVGDAAAELIAQVLPRRGGEELPDLRNRLARAALQLRVGPTMIAADADATIATWLARLPIADRVLITLRYGERLTPAEVARILYRPRAEVDVRLADLLQEVPAPAEAYLAYGLDRLAAAAPGPVELGGSIRHTTGRRTRRRHGVIALLVIAAALSLVAAVAVQVGNRSLELVLTRPDTWQLSHRIEVTPGWAVSGYSLTRSDETTRVRIGKAECQVRVQFWSPVEPWPTIGPPARPVMIGSWRGELIGDNEIRIDGWGGRIDVGCPPEVESDSLLELARSVRLVPQPVPMPIGLRRFPSGTQLVGIDYLHGITWLTFGRPYFTLLVAPRLGRSCPEPPALPKAGPARPEDWILETPDGIACAELRWVSLPDRPIREQSDRSVHELETLLELADPDDFSTWFEAGSTLPPR